MGEFSVTAEVVDGRLVVTLAGELDAAAVGQVRSTLAPAAGRGEDARVDVAGVAAMSPAVLAELWRTRQELESAGHRLVLRSPSPAMTQALDRGFGEPFDIESGGGEEPG